MSQLWTLAEYSGTSSSALGGAAAATATCRSRAALLGIDTRAALRPLGAPPKPLGDPRQSPKRHQSKGLVRQEGCGRGGFIEEL